MVCPNCKEPIALNHKYCAKCGAELIKKKNIKSNVIVAIITTVIIFLIALVVYEPPSSKIVGKWSTDAGMDSDYFDFKSNQDLIWYDMFETSTDSYSFKGKTLNIHSDEKYAGTYEYSERAKFI